MIRRQQLAACSLLAIMLAVVPLSTAAPADLEVTAWKAAATNDTTSLPLATNLPFVKIMLAFDGIDQDYYNQNYRLGARLAVIFAAGMEANKSNVVNVVNGDYQAAVTSAIIASMEAATKRKQAFAEAAVNRTQGVASPAAATARNGSIGHKTKPLHAKIHQEPEANMARGSAAASAPATITPAPAPVPGSSTTSQTYAAAPLSGMQKWIAGIVAPAFTPGASMHGAGSASNRRLLGWQSLMAKRKAALAPPATSTIQDVPATVEVTPDEEAITEGEDQAERTTDNAQRDDAQFDQSAEGALQVLIESQMTPLQALGEFAIITDHPEEVRRRILTSTSNFGLTFYALLHKFGVAQKPSLFMDGSPVLGPAAEALDPAAYAAAAAAAGLTNDGYELQEPLEEFHDYLEPADGGEEELLPDARGNTDAPTPEAQRSKRARIIVVAPKGFSPAVVRGKQDAADAGSGKQLDGVPVWVVVPLAILASLLGLVLIAAAVMAAIRVVRTCRAIAARREDSRDGSSDSSSPRSDMVYGDELIKHQEGGYVATKRAVEKLNASMPPGKGKLDEDRQSLLTQATTITSLQTGGVAATTYLTSFPDAHTTHKFDKPIVSGIRVPSSRDIRLPSNDGSTVSAPATVPGSAKAAAARRQALKTQAAASTAAPIADSTVPKTAVAAVPPPPPLPMPAGSTSLASNDGSTRPAAAQAPVLQPPAGLVVRTKVQSSSKVAPTQPPMDAQAIAQAAAEAAMRIANSRQS